MNCLSESAWTIVKLNNEQPDSGALVAVESGLRFISNPGGTLNWQECSSGCTSASAWSGSDLFYATTLSLAVTAQGQPRMLFNQGGGGPATEQHKLYFAWCNQGCTSSSNWANVGVPTQPNDGEDGLSLLLDPEGNPLFAYATLTGLGVGGCTANCNSSSSTWTTQEVEINDSITPAALKPACNGTDTPQAFWFPGRAVQMALDDAGNAHFIHETYASQRCGHGNWVESSRLLRYTQL
jgi:hypothetical protein